MVYKNVCTRLLLSVSGTQNLHERSTCVSKTSEIYHLGYISSIPVTDIKIMANKGSHSDVRQNQLSRSALITAHS